MFVYGNESCAVLHEIFFPPFCLARFSPKRFHINCIIDTTWHDGDIDASNTNASHRMFYSWFIIYCVCLYCVCVCFPCFCFRKYLSARFLSLSYNAHRRTGIPCHFYFKNYLISSSTLSLFHCWRMTIIIFALNWFYHFNFTFRFRPFHNRLHASTETGKARLCTLYHKINERISANYPFDTADRRLTRNRKNEKKKNPTDKFNTMQMNVPRIFAKPFIEHQTPSPIAVRMVWRRRNDKININTQLRAPHSYTRQSPTHTHTERAFKRMGKHATHPNSTNWLCIPYCVSLNRRVYVCALGQFYSVQKRTTFSVVAAGTILSFSSLQRKAETTEIYAMLLPPDELLCKPLSRSHASIPNNKQNVEFVDHNIYFGIHFITFMCICVCYFCIFVIMCSTR